MDPATPADSELDHLPGASVAAIAQTVGIENLPDEVARALAPDVEYRLREVGPPPTDYPSHHPTHAYPSFLRRRQPFCLHRRPLHIHPRVASPPPSIVLLV
jgi:hypothetical protein